MEVGTLLNLDFEVALTSTIVSDFLCPVTIVGGGGGGGALRFAPVCPSVCPSIRHALKYRVCVINSSHSFQWAFCSLVYFWWI